MSEEQQEAPVETEEQKKGGLIDVAMKKLASRRAWAWLTATLGFFILMMVYISSTDLVDDSVMTRGMELWVDVTMTFLAVVGIDDIAKSWKA